MLLIVNKNEVVGALPRGVIWDNGIQAYTRVASIFIKNKKDLLLVPVRSMSKKYLPGGYDFACGENLHSGETFLDAARRGLRGELGVEIENLGKGILFPPDRKNNIFVFMMVYLVNNFDSNQKIRFDTNEVSSLEWKTVNQIKRLFGVVSE